MTKDIPYYCAHAGVYIPGCTVVRAKSKRDALDKIKKALHNHGRIEDAHIDKIGVSDVLAIPKGAATIVLDGDY